MILPPLNGGTYNQLAAAIHQLTRGGGLNVGAFTLAASPATTTVVSDQNFSKDGYAIAFPLSANAVRVQLTPDAPMYLSARANSSFTFTHVASALSGLDFFYIIMGN